MSLTTQAIEFLALLLIGGFTVPALLVVSGVGLYLNDRDSLGTVLGGAGALSGLAIWYIGPGRVQWLTQNYFQGWHETTRAFDLAFQAGVSDLTSPIGGFLQDLAGTFLGAEAELNSWADHLPNIVTDLKTIQIENPDLFGFEVKELNNSISAIEGIYYVLGEILALPAGIIHGVFTPFAAVFEKFGNFFMGMAGTTPVEAASGFLGAAITFLVLLTSTVILVPSIFEFIFRAAGAGVRWLGSLVGLGESKRPTSKLFKRAIQAILGRIVFLTATLAIAIPLVVYPIANVLGVLLLVAVGAGFIVYGDFGDQDSVWMFGVIAGTVGIPGLVFELGLGLSDTLVFTASGLILLVWGTNYIEKVAPRIASEGQA